MPKAPTNIFEALKTQLRFQTVCGISTFSLFNGDHAERNRFIEIYQILLGVGFIITVIFSFSTRFYTYLAHIVGDSYLWAAIIGFELTFTNIAFPLMLLHSFLSKQKHISFLNRIHSIDKML